MASSEADDVLDERAGDRRANDREADDRRASDPRRARRLRRRAAARGGMPADWRPKVIALDIDGTLLKWVEGTGATSEVMTEAVKEAVRRAYDAGAHIVLASGRSPHGMTRVADLLDLPRDGEDRLWIVASNGAVIVRYPPLDVVHEELFDAGPAVRAIMADQPSALVAVEERGVGYRLNDHFPPGELSGEMTLVDVEELVKEPVSRVIIRNPAASAEEFMEMGRRIGLQGISYVVGWTAWLDLTPIGVSKASGLSYVVDQLGLEPSDVLAIGDGRNDLEMFAWAGRSVAMGQSIPEVLEAADAVTLSVEEDGAAVEISRWF
ncbi:HAD family hydrolase [Nocardioides sp. Iso805N]|uniref:HAD family hydrolase n=1 Tax=Nocardioides sp. Iso805N TaxID=1283287 RepID=UPI00039CF265|nr:HAD family hydrolase [Nocardioides sp. Iso805N]